MTAAARASWLFNRLRCMSPGEVGHRLVQSAVGMLEKRGVLGLDAPPVHAGARAVAVRGAPSLAPGEAEALLRDADRICAGHVTLFADRRFDVGPLPQWNTDPDSGVAGPTRYSGDIAITNRELVGDIKHVWELNRHLHLVRLAQAALVSGERDYLRVLGAQLRSWLDQCPPRRGPNWTSALEMGIRLINWSLIWQLTGGEASQLFAGSEGEQLRRDWLASIHAHCRCIARHLSRHSSANNHLIGELAGLFVGAATWPCWKESSDWQRLAARELEAQAQAQYTRDGVNREQAFAYHIFSAEFLFAAGLAGQTWQHPFSRAYWDVLLRALRFLRSVRDCGGHVPNVGDADDGIVWRLDATGEDRAAQLLALGDAVLLGRETDSAGVRWLRHALPGPLPQPHAGEPETAWAFPEGGYLLFGQHFGEAHEIKGMLDCGPLGYLGIAAHGHADALALTLSVAGEEVLIDPGTYSYWQGQQWRDYFRGTSAHNTVRVDGLDQSVSGGRFMWIKKAIARIEKMPQSPQDFDFRGSHDGYLRLPDPVRHLRAVRFDGAAATLTVRDEIAARKPHRIEQFWHFAPGLDLSLNSEGLRVRGRRVELQLTISGGGLGVELLRGVADPPLGWQSRSYEAKGPCDVLRISTVSSALPLECRIKISFLQ